MTSSAHSSPLSLEEEYIRVKEILYKNLFRYCAVIILIVLIKEAIRAFVFDRIGSLIVLSVVMAFGSVLVYIVWRSSETQELSITIFFILLFLSALLAQYYTNSGYLDNPLDAFNFAYCYAVFERLVLARISKFSYRVTFIVFTTIVRVANIPAENLALYLMQFVYLFFTIYLDMDKEKYDKNFFLTYYKNKEQLLKFKNLLVQDIPESIVIVTQDLMKPLFVNNSFEELVKDNSDMDIRSKLQHFYLQENTGTQLSRNDSPLEKQTLLTFLESIVLSKSLDSQTQKFSCNLSYKKLIGENNENEEHYEEYVFEAKAIHLLWDDEPAIAVILHDITQQHTILSLKIADAHKDTILATVSHELRTPLNGILGMIQIMQKKIKDSELLNYLNICKNSGDLLMSLVNSILDLNQIRAKKLKLCLEKISLVELMANIVSLFQFQCQQKGLYLKLKIDPTCPKELFTDKNRLTQIFINLVGNALKFTRDGGIIILVNNIIGSDSLTFTVEDTGSGIKDEDKKKLFQTFGKLKQSDRNVNPHGVGLGLTISDNLARMLGIMDEGIRLESQYGKGSKFFFTIRKTLREVETEVQPDSAVLDSARRQVDEKGGVSDKMLNYSKDFVKSSSKLMTTAETNTTMKTFNTSEPLHKTNPLSPKNYNSFSVHRSKSIKTTPYALVIDDNPFNIVIAESLINSQGYKTKTALYGQVAIDMVLNCNFAVEPIKLIFMDCQMPVMDGYTATKILKKLMLEKKIPEIPIVALTANDSEADKAATKRVGMCEHLTKPLEESELVRILNKYMD